MEVFLQHVGKNNIQHIEDTVTNQRSVRELLGQLSNSAPERNFFISDQNFTNAFPNGNFNCWACPIRAERRFIETNVGDLVLILPSLGDYDSGIHYLGIVKAKCSIRAFEASKILWPLNENIDHIFPYLFFFDTEMGFRSWHDFLTDLRYDSNFNPRGYYLRIKSERFERWGGEEGYHRFLQEKGNFRSLFTNTSFASQKEIKLPKEVNDRSGSVESPPILRAIDLGESVEPERSTVETTRIVRDSVLTRSLKALHENRCQICGYAITFPDGRTYSEAHHIKPLGGDHKGPDVAENILILCPNHHAACDLGAIKLVLTKIRSHPQHRINNEFLNYHNTYIYQGR